MNTVEALLRRVDERRLVLGNAVRAGGTLRHQAAVRRAAETGKIMQWTATIDMQPSTLMTRLVRAESDEHLVYIRERENKDEHG